MSKNRSKISYDKESKVLSIQVKRGRSVDSDIQGNAVFDYDSKGDVVRVNLYDFSFESFRKDLKAFRDFSKQSRMPVSVR